MVTKLTVYRFSRPSSSLYHRDGWDGCIHPGARPCAPKGRPRAFMGSTESTPARSVATSRPQRFSTVGHHLHSSSIKANTIKLFLLQACPSHGDTPVASRVPGIVHLPRRQRALINQVDGLTVGEIQRVVESQRLVSMAAEQQDRCGCLVVLIVK